jgi:general secretion pathway protein G
LLLGLGLTLLVLCVWFPRQIGGSKKGDAVSGCRTLSIAIDSFTQSPSNPKGDLPRTLEELHRPPWGGASFLPEGERDLRDPWGNLYGTQPRQRSDGYTFLLVVTSAPDGTLISQFGAGPKAVPPDDRAPPPNKMEVLAAQWLNRGTALGLLLGICIAAWYAACAHRKKQTIR